MQMTSNGKVVFWTFLCILGTCVCSHDQIFLQKDAEELQKLLQDPQKLGEIVRTAAQYAVSMANVSMLCQKHTSDILGAMGNPATGMWAVQMIDSWGKPLPSATFRGNIAWLGAFQGCQAVKGTGVGNYKNETFRGKYCLNKISFKTTSTPSVNLQQLAFSPDMLQQLLDLLKNLNMASAQIFARGLRMGTCLPDTCTDTEVRHLINIGLQQMASVMPIANMLHVSDSHCEIPVDEWKFSDIDSKGKGVMGMLLVFGAIIFIATLVDYFLVNADKRKELWFRLLVSFSLTTNLPKLLSSKSGQDSLRCVNGIRVISLSWIILGHLYLIILLGGFVANPLDLVDTLPKRISFQAIQNASVSVDTFFVLSGFLVAYLFFTRSKRKDLRSPSFWFLYYFHRFWRLTPPYLLFIGAFVGITKYIGTGPFYGDHEATVNACKEKWWINLLYINNFYKAGQFEQCIGWSWYLANDMQFYIVAPIFLLAYFYGGPIIGSVFSSVGILLSMVSTFAILTYYNIATDDPRHFTYYYIKPYCRAAAYLIGLMTGYFVAMEKRKTLRLNLILNLILWAVFGTVACACLYGLHPYNAGEAKMEVGINALYQTFMRPGWSLAIAWVLFTCCTGNGGIINSILSWSGWVPFGKLNYTTYLNHGIVTMYFCITLQMTFFGNDQLFIMLFCGIGALCYAFAIPMSLAFESPFLGLEKVILPSRKPRPAPPLSEQEPPYQEMGITDRPLSAKRANPNIYDDYPNVATSEPIIPPEHAYNDTEIGFDNKVYETVDEWPQSTYL